MTAALALVGALGLVGYAYLGYPLLCLLKAWIAPFEVAARPIRPGVTVVIAAWRELHTIAEKLASLARQTYPPELLEVILVCDGSDDGTPLIARAVNRTLLPGRLRVIEQPRRGKPSALNTAVAAARGEILIFTDARQRLEPTAVLRLVEALGDPRLGAAGGELVLDGNATASAYWRYEAWLRRVESRAGHTVGLSGALYALRRSAFVPLPEETILDDVLVPARARLQGLRVAVVPEAIAFDRVGRRDREFQRKVRTLSGSYQLLMLAPELLAPWRNPSSWALASHKLLRNLVPFALVVALIASFLLAPPIGPLLACAQLAAYAVAGLREVGLLRRWRFATLCDTFVVLHVAAAAGLVRFLRHGRSLPW